jgi:hypothetical protein
MREGIIRIIELQSKLSPPGSISAACSAVMPEVFAGPWIYSVCSTAAGIFATDIKDRATWLSN